MVEIRESLLTHPLCGCFYESPFFDTKTTSSIGTGMSMAFCAFAKQGIHLFPLFFLVTIFLAMAMEAYLGSFLSFSFLLPMDGLLGWVCVYAQT